MYKKLIMCCLIVGLVCPSPDGAGLMAKEADKTVQIKALTLSPTAEPVPAMGYRLLPRQLDKKTGNAALLYHEAAALCPDGGEDSVAEKIGKWRDMPVDELPRKEVEKVLASYSKCLHLIELASRRADCDWETPVEEGFSLQIGPLATFRRMVFALQLQIRLKIADGQIDEAFEMLQQGIQMGRDIAEGPTIIQRLVGTAITAVMLKEVEGLMQRPDSPNLYWALTALPDPMIDMYPAIEYEREAIFLEFPRLRNLEDEVLTPAQALAMISDFMNKIQTIGGPGPDMPLEGLLPMGWVMAHYSDAKQFLSGRGFSQQRIEAMPAAQAVLIYQKQEYLEMLDNMFKWFALPYHRSLPYLEEGEKVFSRHNRDKGLKANLFGVFLPALYRIAFLQVRLDRHIAMLRTVEAIRMFAADHSGRLPGSLGEITSVPIPIDPVTGDEFLYRRTDARNARLEAPVSPAESRKRPVYELTVRR